MWLDAISSIEAPERVREMFRARRQLGIERYGTPLQAHNGRDVLRDIAEETLDRIAYLQQLATERPDFADRARALQRLDVQALIWLGEASPGRRHEDRTDL